MALVLDASAVVFAVTQNTAPARRLRDRMRTELSHAPQLIDVEVGSALRRLVADNQLTASRGERLLTSADAVIDRRHDHDLRLRRAAWQLRQNLTFYDAMYVALAASLGLTLVTTDARITRAPRLPCDVELIVSS